MTYNPNNYRRLAFAQEQSKAADKALVADAYIAARMTRQAIAKLAATQ